MPTLNTTNANTTLESIKQYIRDERGDISPELQRAIITTATIAYEIKGALNPRRTAILFVTGNIFTAKNS